MTVVNTPNQTMIIHDLNPEKGIINIGSHPENDVVVQDPRVMPFHMMVDLRQKPYLVIGLDPNAEISIDGVKISENESVEIMDINQVSFSGYSLSSTAKNGSDSINQIAVITRENGHDYHTNPAVFETRHTSSPLVGLPVKESISTTELQSYVPTSDVILVEPHEQKLTIDVDQTAIFPFTIINGGSIVASFDLKVEGVPAEWVKVVPERVNLNEGGRGRVEVHITPPRNPDSHAGDYSVLVKVGSYNYPGQVSGVRVDLTINPYYEFTVGNLSPRYKRVSWNRNSAVAQFPITNQGNSTTNYLVMAQDDENGCKFEFQVQDDVSLVKQAEIAIKPGEVRDLPVKISPNKRHLVRLRSKQYQYSVTTQSLNENAASRIVSGTIDNRPLFGLFSILLALTLLLISAFFILRPRIIDFNVVEDVIALGEPAILNWKVTPFTSNLRIEGVSEEISGSQNQVEVIPTNTAETYTLVAGNWLSRLLRMDDVRSDPITVLAIPPSPQISTFFVDKTRIFEGDDITIKWSVTDAEETFLTVDGVRSALSPDEFNSERTVTLRNDSLVVLEAKNDSGSKFQSEFIHAQKPTILIEEFTLSDTTIIRGESVTIKWKVSGIGVENVMIAPFEEVYPLEGELTFFPEASMEFVLTVKNRDLEQIKLLPVGVLEPGAEPEPPTVEFFKVAPEEIVGSGKVEFSWSVSGISDRIEISSIDGVVLAGLPAQGFMSFNVSKTTSYVLTAYNGDLSSAAILEVKVNETKKNAIVEIDKILPSTAINRGDSVMVYYSVYPATKDGVIVDSEAMGWPEISGSVVVTDGFDTCDPVDLPVHACSLTLNTSEENKQIYATYSGDDNYVRRTSDPYPLGLDVVGASAKFTSFTYSVSPIVVGQQTTVSFQVAPEDPAATIPITGKVKVLNNEVTLCIATLSAAIDNPMAAKGECLLTFINAASEYLSLVYEGNDIYDGKIASMPVLEVKQANTQTILTSNWSTTTVVGESILVEFSIGAMSPGTGIPTGQVTVMNKNNPIDKCTATLNSTGKGQCSLLLNQTGTIEVIGEYVGDDNYIASKSISYFHPVSKASTTTTISSFTPTSTTVGQQVLVKYLVKVVAPGSGVPTGNVTINAGNGNTCTGAINATGAGECAVLMTKTGVQSVSATYAGDGSFNSSVGSGYSYTVSIAGTKTIVSTPEPSPSAISDLVKVSFTVSLSQTSLIKPNGTARVEASTGENCLATVTDGEGFCNLTFATEGTRTIKVLFLGTSDYAASESTSITHIVVRESKTSITSTTLNPVVDQSVKIDFSVVAVTGGGGTPTGEVTVNSDTGETCSGTLTNGSGSCSIIFTKSGIKNLTAIYQGNTEYKTSTSAVYPISVAKASTTTEITSDLSTTKQVGESINVAVKVTANISAIPTGSVTVSIVGSTDPRETCSFSLSAGIGACSLTLINSGIARQVQAVYAGTTDRFAGSTSDIVTQKVDPAVTTTTIISDDPDPSTVNQAVTFKVGVRVNTLDTLRPTGTFSIKLIEGVNETTLCTGNLNTTTSEGTCSYTFTSMGGKSIKAVYSGATDYASSTSALITHSVASADTTTSINIATNPSILNQTIAVNVTVTGTGTSVISPSGTVNITASRTGSTPLTCTITLNSSGAGTCNITPNAVGDWTVRADYLGDSNFKTSTDTVTQTVNKVESVTTITLPTAGSIIGQSFPINITVAKPASAPGSGTLGGNVVVTATKTGATTKTCTINDISSGSGSCNLTLDVIGDWTITAVYSGNTDFLGSTATATHTVKKVPTTTTIESISPTTSVTGQPITVSVKVVSSGGTPTGIVTVNATYSGVTRTCSITLNSGIGTCDITPTLAGTWTITAAYQGTTTTFDTSSASQTRSVSKANTTTSVTLPTSAIVVGQSFNVSVSVAAVSPGSGTPTGSVSVTATKTGSASVSCTITTLTTGAGSCLIVLPASGTWTITGVYSGDLNFITSSGASDKNIGLASTTTSVTNTSSIFLFPQFVTVEYEVKVTSPGSGTPTGTVTVTATIKVAGDDPVVTCSSTVSAGECQITLTQTGTWEITAVYSGDSNFSGSNSPIFNHTLN